MLPLIIFHAYKLSSYFPIPRCKYDYSGVNRSLHLLRTQLHILDGGARFHVASQLIRESINHGKFMFVNSISGTEDSSEPGGNLKESGTIFNLLQKERVLSAVCNGFFCCFCCTMFILDSMASLYLKQVFNH